MTARRRFGLPIVLLLSLLCSSVFADAIVVDNDDGSPAYVETGTWSTSGGTGYNGGTYRWTTPGTAATATWTADLPEAGEYEVFVWYVSGTNRTTSTRYDVVARRPDTTPCTSTRPTTASPWFSLGTYSFNAGSATITLDAANSTGGTAVVADAVRFGSEGGCLGEATTPEEVAAGVWHTVWTLPAPQVLHVLEFDLADRHLDVEMGLARGVRNYSAKEATQHHRGALRRRQRRSHRGD